MIEFSDYNKATNAAYELLAEYQGRLPVIDVFQLVSCLSNVKIHTYSELANEIGIDFDTFLREYASSEHGFTFYNKSKNRYIICYNELKDETTIRFTIAHELGHIILKHDKDSESTDKEANCFARNILCPVQIADGFGVRTVREYVNCFEISEPMAEATVSLRGNDSYYITKENYQRFSEVVYCYFSGYNPAGSYGY